MPPSPPMKPPPWIHTMTGRPPRPTTGGVYTFRYRQSSDVLVVITPVAMLPVWAHAGPGQVAAFLTPVHRAAGRGARHRRAPTGGAAYGMPKNSRAPLARSPRTAPLSVRTTSGAGQAGARAAAVRAGVTGLAAAAPAPAPRPAASPRVTASGTSQQAGRTTRRRNVIAGSSP